MNCRACHSPSLTSVLNLGEMPLVNALPETATAVVPRFPLELFFCSECTLLQLGYEVPPGTLFSDYTYFSSYSETMVEHARSIAEALVESQQLDGSSLVIELASNDGYLLQHYQRRNVPVLGIEPAGNVAAVARERGIPTVSKFFGESLAKQLVSQKRRADVIHANNVLAHVPDLPGFVRAIASLLKSDGVAVIEVPHAIEMVERAAFDTIYHEHLCYFSLTALARLFDACGLQIFAVEKIAIHGGSLRLPRRCRSFNPSMRPSRPCWTKRRAGAFESSRRTRRLQSASRRCACRSGRRSTRSSGRVTASPVTARQPKAAS